MRSTFSLRNINNQWKLVAAGLVMTAIFALWLVPPVAYINWLFAGLMLVPAAQFAWAAYKKPFPLDEPWSVRRFDDLKRAWHRFSKPAVVDTFNDQKVLCRWDSYDFRTIYDGAGRAIATEQTINWSDTDLDWRPGDPEHVERIVRDIAGSGKRLPWLARLRSPQLD